MVLQVAEMLDQTSVCVGVRSSRGKSYPTLELPDGRKVLVSYKNPSVPQEFFGAIRSALSAQSNSLSEALKHRAARWRSPQPLDPTDLGEVEIRGEKEAVRESWIGALDIRMEHGEGDDYVPGLRAPQVGAIHAIKAHWVVSSEPATLVMPTGTGKTETMLAALVSEPIDTLLVVVPTDALRSQTSRKFATLGELKRIGCLSERACLPIVAVLRRCPKSEQEIDELFGRAQVVVATMAALSRMPAELQTHMARRATHLFIDEAHHNPARTWKTLKRRFVEQKRKILQFTATPYRTDEKRVDGKFIFVYPLRQAQQQGLFAKIHYVPVYDSRREQADLAIVKKVGEALDADAARGFTHLAMSRVDSIPRAEAIEKLYHDNLARYPARTSFTAR